MEKAFKSTHNEYDSASQPRYERKKENEGIRYQDHQAGMFRSPQTGPTLTDWLPADQQLVWYKIVSFLMIFFFQLAIYNNGRGTYIIM
jgi:hypothetical protein